MIGYVSEIIISCLYFYFFYCRKVWPNTKIFFCLWHVKKAWQKQACIKIKDVVVRVKVLKNMVRIMHDIAQPNGKTPLEFAKEKLIKLMEMIPDAQVF